MAAEALFNLSASEMALRLRARECSAVELTRSCIERARERESVVKAFVQLDADGALRQAEALDRGDITGPLHGIPIAIKDTIDVAGLRCTFGTEIHADRFPSRDAEVVRRLRAAGAVILGTTVSTEYAIARAGPTTNPYDASRTPGGSSSGSAAAVASGMAPIALGTQTVGSIVRPSAYCGIFGYKPPKDAVPTDGAMPLSPFLDHVGPMARCIDDVELVYRAMTDRGDETRPATLPKTALFVQGPFDERLEPPSRLALTRARTVLQGKGLTVLSVTLPAAAREAKPCWETILFRDLAKHHGTDRDRFGVRMSDRFRKIIDDGRRVTDSAYEAAIAFAGTLREQVLGLLSPGSIFVAPAVDGVAPAFSEHTGASDLQGLWSLTGLPALAVPCGKADGLPIGMQLVGRPMEEHFVHATGRLFEGLQKGSD
jgi:Asp-tRNA(Asn)/Glu-tRNA(Gln) amidotransferase A subunit family amidase